LIAVLLIGFIGIGPSHAQDEIENILANGGFEDGIAVPWSTYGSVTTEVVEALVGAAVPEDPIEGDFCLHIVVPAAGANFWDSGLQYAGHVFEQGKKYTLSAFLKCKEGTLDINFKPELGQDPWPGYGAQSFTMTEEWTEFSTTTPVFTEDVDPATITFHIAYTPGDFWIDGVRWYEGDYVPPELGKSGLASKPVPEDGALYLDTWVSLVWKAGDFALSHDVYFGDNFDDINDGIGDTFRGNQASANYIVGFLGFAFPDGLVPGVTYYWRIDEVNDTDPNSPWKGDVWSFTIPPKKAYNPDPPDGSMFENPDAELSWEPGFGVKLHYIYFGDNFDDVNNATVGIPSALNTYNPGTLELEKFYYWRIDEFDGFATHKGDVWRFRTLPVIPISDPDLVGWWTLDEGMGTTVVDWSGHGNHGTFQGDPQWVAGMLGGALDFDGNGDYVDCGNDAIFDITDAFTVAAWINIRAVASDWCTVVAKGDSAWRISTNGSTQGMHFGFEDGSRGWQAANSASELPLNEWHYVCGTYDIQNGGRIYIDGVLDGTNSDTGGITLSTYNVYIGENAQATGRFWDGLIDSVRVYDKALTAEEIKLAMRGDPLVAWGPNPSPGSTPYIRDATSLSWSKGDNASQHDVYFGTYRDAVADADSSDTTAIYRGRQSVTIYTPPDVEWGGGPYYWRVDEYNTDATISKGNLWSFTVADFIGIDDIEDYNDYPPDEIFSTWIDGWEVPTNGSMAGHAEPPFAETNIVHGGGQSMPVYYENNLKYSEVTMTLVYPRNWTEEGVGVLSLWFYGDASNAAEPMYVALNGSAVVYHDNPNAVLIDTWTQWTIDLQEFAAQGVNLANVNTISIGFGDKNNLRAGGSGVVFFDDIRLYRPAQPEPEPAP